MGSQRDCTWILGLPGLGRHPKPGQSQLVDATNRLNTSDAFIQPNVCRGRLLSWRATALNSARV